jgi:excisionase family DNA binding protein
MSAPALLTVAETAERLAVSPDTVRRWIKDGTLGVFQVGRIVRVPESSVVALIEGRTTLARGRSRPRPERRPARPRRPAVSRPDGDDPLAVLRRLRAEEGGRG